MNHGVNLMEVKEHTNVFVDVHDKIRAFKDRLREVNQGHAELRKERLVQESNDLRDTDV